MTYRVTRDFSAPAEVVFGIATDLQRWGRWLPPGVRVERTGADELRVDWGDGDQTVRWHVQPEAFSVTAAPPSEGWLGNLTVIERPAGGSTARIEIDGDAGPVAGAAARALAGLDAEVDDNLTPG